MTFFAALQATVPGTLGRAEDTAAGQLGRLFGSGTLLGSDSVRKVVYSAAAVLVILVARRIVLRYVDRRFEDPRTRYQWSKTSAYVAFLIGILIVGQIWLEAVRQIGTFLGLLSAGLAIALRDVVANLAAWSFILWRRPFELGDRIQIGDTRGDVVDIRIFQFSLLEIGNWVHAEQSTGRVVHVPNSRVLTEPLSNYTVEFPFIWDELRILVTFESDWRKAKRILMEAVDEVGGEVVEKARQAVKRASRKYLIHYKYVTPIVYTSVEDSGILLTLRYICGVRSRRGTEEGIWERVLDAFAAEEDVDFAYPTWRIYHNLLEGKEGARAEVPTWLRSRVGEGDEDGGPRPSR